jgi:hypothetical protein
VNSQAEFIPMVFSLNTLPNISFKNTILGFNEPDNVNQSNISVADALLNWSVLVNNSVRVGSPSTSGDPLLPGSWLTKFMNGTP